MIRLQSLSNLSRVFVKSFTRFLLVRHPFDRLASAYADKISNVDETRRKIEPYYDEIRQRICRRYALFNVSRNSSAIDIQCQRMIPSFEHFLQYVLHNARDPIYMDVHWRPYSWLCQVCKWKYNFISKYETLDQDLPYLLKRVVLPDWKFRKRPSTSGKSNQTYRQLFSTVPEKLICELKHLYDDDFRLFNYRLEEFVGRPSLFCHRSVR